MSTKKRGRTTPWTATGVVDENARRLVDAAYRHRARLAAECPMDPVQSYVVLSPTYGEQGGFPIGALVRLWESSPVFRGRCPACRGSALGLAAGGMLDWHLHGVCRRCGSLVHRLFFRSTLHAEIERCLVYTPYHLGSGAWLNASNGQPHARLVAALARLGAAPLPEPGYGFLGGHPSRMREQRDPVAARAESWASRAPVTHRATGAAVERTPPVLALATDYVAAYLRRTGRLPELEHDGDASLRFAFPIISDAPSSPRPASAHPLGADSSRPRWVVREIRSDPFSEEVVWQSEHDHAHDADAALDARVAHNRLGAQGLGEIVLFDRWERRVARSVGATDPDESLVGKFLVEEDRRRAAVPDRPRDDVPATPVDPDDAVQADVDLVIAAWRDGRVDEEAFERLTQALEDDSQSWHNYEETITEVLDRATIQCAFAAIDDEDVRLELDLPDGARVRDAHRVRFLEQSVLSGLMDDADVSHAFTPVTIVATDGTEAVMFSDVQGYSFSGVTTTWHGPYESADAFVDELLAEGWIMGADALAGLSLRRKLAILRPRT